MLLRHFKLSISETALSIWCYPNYSPFWLLFQKILLLTKVHKLIFNMSHLSPLLPKPTAVKSILISFIPLYFIYLSLKCLLCALLSSGHSYLSPVILQNPNDLPLYGLEHANHSVSYGRAGVYAHICAFLTSLCSVQVPSKWILITLLPVSLKSPLRFHTAASEMFHCVYKILPIPPFYFVSYFL